MKAEETFYGWISVNDSLPEKYEVVIINREKFVSAGTFHGNYWWDRGYDCECTVINPVTHWMPLPKPPQK